MRRREFLGVLGGTAVWSFAALGQQSAKLPTIGFFDATSPATQGPLAATFVQRLRELGWSDGRNVTIEVRWGEGRRERYNEIVAEFVRLKVDVIVTYAVPAVIAAKRATSVIPIVFAAANDPVGNGLVASLCAARRQRDRPINPGCRYCRQEDRNSARGNPQSAPTSYLGQRCSSQRRVGVGRSSGSSPQVRCRCHHVGSPSCRQYRTRLRGAQGARGGALCRSRPSH